MSTRHLTDEEMERMIASTLSCPPDLVPSPEFACGVWNRIDVWEAAQEREKASRSILARLMETRMRNGEPVVVLVAALLFGALFVGIFLTGAYTVSYTHLRAHETRHDLVCRLLLEKKKKNKQD